MSKRAKQLMMAAFLPIIILLAMCVAPVYTLLSGEEITLQTRPVDPTDLFRGDYVHLNYEAEEVPSGLVDPGVVKKVETSSSQTTVFVILKNKNGVYRPVRVSLKKPDRGIYLKGKVNYIGVNGNQDNVAMIQYSLDKYFVEDNTGTDWEKASIGGNLLAKVKVKNGYAYLTGIMVKK